MLKAFRIILLRNVETSRVADKEEAEYRQKALDTTNRRTA